MISITTDTASNYVPIILNELPSSDLDTETARISRAATLDGGVYINNTGFSDGDRTLKITARLTDDDVTNLNYVKNNFLSIILSMKDGAYKAAIQNISRTGNQYNLTIYIEERISA